MEPFGINNYQPTPEALYRAERIIMKKPTKKELELIDLAVRGLYTDGGHHKQYYLEQIILKITGFPIDEVRKQIGHEPGM